MRQTYANLGYLGMTSIKAFGILVEARGEGCKIAGIAGIARHRRDRETRNWQNPTPNCTLMRQTYAKLGCLGMNPSQVYANLG